MPHLLQENAFRSHSTDYLRFGERLPIPHFGFKIVDCSFCFVCLWGNVPWLYFRVLWKKTKYEQLLNWIRGIDILVNISLVLFAYPCAAL